MSSKAAPARVIVTGASGFVGSWVMQCLEEQKLRRDVEVFPFGMSSGAFPRLDVTDGEEARRVVNHINPTAIIHLAAVALPVAANQDWHNAWSVNFMGTLNLAQAAHRQAKAVRFVFAGSSEVYGRSFNSASGPLDESAKLEPISVYGATKAAADIMLGQMACDGLCAVRFRPFNHTGPGQTASYVVSAFAKQIAEIEAGSRARVIKVGNLDTERDFLDVRDVASAYVKAAIGDHVVKKGVAINLASGQIRSVRSILDFFLVESKIRIKIEIDPKLLRLNELPRVHGNPQLAAQILQWRARTPLEQTLRDTLQFWRQHLY